MKITEMQDPAQVYRKLAKDTWDALESALSGEDLTNIQCLEPAACYESPEITKRKWMGLITVSNIINLRVNIGGEDAADVLASLDYCNC